MSTTPRNMDQPVPAPLSSGKAAVLAARAAVLEKPAEAPAAGMRSEVDEPAATSPKRMGYKDVINRTVFTIVMAYVFLGAISLGIIVGIIIVESIQITIFHEITRIHKRERKERQIPSVTVIKWYFYVVCVVHTLLYTMRDLFTSSFPATEALYDKLAFLGFSAAMLGIMMFVLSLRKGMYRYQFIQFTWTVMSLMFVVSQTAAEMGNMVRGMIWFLVPVSCVVNNDIWAYMFGKLFGRTKLLALSPKKTVEGFVGAFLFTVIWSFWFCGFLSYFPEMYCPAVGFTNAVNSKCEKSSLYVQEEVALPAWLQSISGGQLTTMLVSPAQRHAIVLGVFASLVAPFGGFFASGLKRAFKLKDFGDLIPGHGGMTDRMDCQGIMGLFTYFYLCTYVFREPLCIASLSGVTSCALRLTRNEREQLAKELLASL